MPQHANNTTTAATTSNKFYSLSLGDLQDYITAIEKENKELKADLNQTSRLAIVLENIARSCQRGYSAMRRIDINKNCLCNEHLNEDLRKMVNEAVRESNIWLEHYNRIRFNIGEDVDPIDPIIDQKLPATNGHHRTEVASSLSLSSMSSPSSGFDAIQEVHDVDEDDEEVAVILDERPSGAVVKTAAVDGANHRQAGDNCSICKQMDQQMMMNGQQLAKMTNNTSQISSQLNNRLVNVVKDNDNSSVIRPPTVQPMDLSGGRPVEEEMAKLDNRFQYKTLAQQLDKYSQSKPLTDKEKNSMVVSTIEKIIQNNKLVKNNLINPVESAMFNGKPNAGFYPEAEPVVKVESLDARRFSPPTNGQMINNNQLVKECQNRFFCMWPACGASFTLKANLQLHLQQHYPNYRPEVSFDLEAEVDKNQRQMMGQRIDGTAAANSIQMRNHLNSNLQMVQMAPLAEANLINSYNNNLQLLQSMSMANSMGQLSPMSQMTLSQTMAQRLEEYKRTRYSGVGRYRCPWPECGYTPHFLRDLRRHMHKHTGEKRYKCDRQGCDFITVWKTSLLQHQRKKHQDDATNNSNSHYPTFGQAQNSAPKTTVDGQPKDEASSTSIPSPDGRTQTSATTTTISSEDGVDQSAKRSKLDVDAEQIR